MYLDFFKAFISVCHRLLIKEIAAMGINLKINCWVEEFLKSRTLRVKLGGHLSTEGSFKAVCPRALCLDPFSS